MEGLQQKKEMENDDMDIQEEHLVSFENEEWNQITEGNANVLFPKGVKNNVFYNPVQETNRDISVAAIQSYINLVKEEESKLRMNKNSLKEGFTILEALSATGIKINQKKTIIFII